MVEEIRINDELWAIIVRDDFKKEGITFFTDNDSSQQLAFMNHPKGKLIQAHIHNPVPRAVDYTQEVLFIKSGKLSVDFFDVDCRKIDSKILTKGDVILLCKGGHGFEVIEDLTMIEVKQGPYIGELDKTKLDIIN